ncbi:unnamed protein product [Bursaphelenchus xylophilus]|uniref:(pine wood nematode) hypothetical protein n=1 Tax=Bursaphelenchus xylophilus TaxID=6326 RepID=A0A1I7SQ43_BURXY|nr:unnamed protein product [Bursaphelenchus xylophilus]CAG9109585.1 unnamed protein product [Bursaphelenchus xylophilus]
MVVFTCDRCNEPLKKPKVKFHSCRSTTFTCVDCFVTFDWNTYDAHNKCITEGQRYGGAGFVQESYKGEKKQEKWSQQVSEAINFTNGMVKNFLIKMSGMENVPRKRKPFINFCKNALRVQSDSVAEQIWDQLQAAVRRMEEKDKEEQGKNEKNGEVKGENGEKNGENNGNNEKKEEEIEEEQNVEVKGKETRENEEESKVEGEEEPKRKKKKRRNQEEVEEETVEEVKEKKKKKKRDVEEDGDAPEIVQEEPQEEVKEKKKKKKRKQQEEEVEERVEVEVSEKKKKKKRKHQEEENVKEEVEEIVEKKKKKKRKQQDEEDMIEEVEEEVVEKKKKKKKRQQEENQNGDQGQIVETTTYNAFHYDYSQNEQNSEEKPREKDLVKGWSTRIAAITNSDSKRNKFEKLLGMHKNGEHRVEVDKEEVKRLKDDYKEMKHNMGKQFDRGQKFTHKTKGKGL